MSSVLVHVVHVRVRVVNDIPPQALDAEMAVLGAVLVDDLLYESVAAIVSVADFHSPAHATIWQTFARCIERQQPIDKVSCVEDLRARDMLDKIGGPPYLSLCMDSVQSIASAEYYARIVREKSTLRNLIRAGTVVQRLGYEGESDPARAIAEAERAVRAVAESGLCVGTGTVTVGAHALGIVDALDAGTCEPSYALPWPTLSLTLGGMTPGELVALVAAPKVGKSGWVAMLGRWMAERYGPVLHLALENGIDRTVRRLLALETGISARAQRVGDVTWDARRRLRVAAGLYGSLRYPYHVVDRREVHSLPTLRRTLSRLRDDGAAPKLLILDHAGYLSEARSDGKRTKNDVLAELFVAVRDLAGDYGACCVSVHHLNREGMKGEPGMQSLAYIRDGGNPEGVCDAAIFLHLVQPSGHDADIERQSVEAGAGSYAKMIVGASRDGDRGAVDARYIGHRNLWLELGQVPWFEGRAANDEALREARAMFGQREADDDDRFS